MPSVIIVEKLGTIKSSSIKTFSESEIYKKAGLKSPDDFKCQTTWNIEDNNKKYSISLYGKTKGRANQENKYEFPPPVDKVLYFGNCILVNTTDNKVTDLSVKEWESIYEKLYGGFEDILDDDEDEEDDDEDDEDDPALKTKSGYEKDGFVVDDDDDDDDEYGEEEEEEENEDDEEEDDDEDDDAPKQKTKAKQNKKSKKPVKKGFDIPIIETTEEDVYLDCKSELSEESYIDE
jgi:hypothetical protein